MQKVINTKSGPFFYQPVSLFNGRKKINKSVARSNLFDLADVLQKRGLRYGLIYGTLLGAVRDGDFIEWDEDVDLFVLDEDREALLSSLRDIASKGLLVVRYDNDLLSVMRDDDYIDMYFFRKSLFRTRICGSHSLPARYFNNLGAIEFLGRKMPCLDHVEDFLEFAYGQDWRTPKANAHADPKSLPAKLKAWIRPLIPQRIRSYYQASKAQKT